MDQIKWRFTPSWHSGRKGISSGDSEAFKGSPYKAFAREILQNSIDARASDEEPTVVEFQVFDMETNQIPGYFDLKNAVRRCIEYWSYNKQYVDEYKRMSDLLDKKTIKCLRVSDFNTTGLIGVDTLEQAGNKFLALTKGTGVSEKSGTVAAGSKGVGKNAAFEMSMIKTIFYSTRANKNIDNQTGNYVGSIGVAEFVSGYVDDEVKDKRDYTQGTGFYCNDEFKSAIDYLINFEPNYKRMDSEFGTDIYILGFLDGEDWEREVINSILDSFMATVVRGQLVVNFNGLSISKDTVSNIVYDDNLIFKNNRSNIISQYRLLTDGEHVNKYDIDTEYGVCELSILKLTKEEEDLATHKCVMIRHPLMKIKEENLGSSFRVSAMCIINNGLLGQILREIENPQHIDWETKRIKDRLKKKEVENVLKSIREQINQRVIECLQIGDESPIDPIGAGDYLPDVDFGDNIEHNKPKRKPSENVSISKPKTNISTDSKAEISNDNGAGLVPDIGNVDESEDGEVLYPEGENEIKSESRFPGQEVGKQITGDAIIFKHAKLSGVKYKVISTDKKKGKVKVIFTAPIDNESCYLSLFLLDDMGNSSEVNIKSMTCNGNDVQCENGLEYGPFTIKTNEKIVLEIETNVNGYFACGVKVICK